MFKNCFLILLLAHIIGDFYVQTNHIAEKKENSIKWVIGHCLSYWVTVLVILLPFISDYWIKMGSVLAGTHLVIDGLKYYYKVVLKKKYAITEEKNRSIFFADQLLHIICIVIISYSIALQNGELKPGDAYMQFLQITGISGAKLTAWVTAMLILHKPVNLAISNILIFYKPESNPEEKRNDKKAGRVIGTVERVIMLLFMAIGEYSAVGLVLTAKSIARYDRISKDKDFAEYYLLGTLMSVVSVIVVSFLI